MRENERELERILKALANRRRLAIIRYLVIAKEAAVGDIAEHIKLSFKATSKHLLILSSVDILEKRQVSLNILYSIREHKNNLLRSIL